MQIADPLNDGISIWVGGKVSNARTRAEVLAAGGALPAQQPAALAGSRSRPSRPSWSAGRKGARKYERVGEWIERIGWPKFFQLTGFEFTKYHIDDFKHAGLTYKRSCTFPS